jgi:hypothetical protein
MPRVSRGEAETIIRVLAHALESARPGGASPADSDIAGVLARLRVRVEQVQAQAASPRTRASSVTKTKGGSHAQGGVQQHRQAKNYPE